jgi:Flp pilus assembly protein TadG
MTFRLRRASLRAGALFRRAWRGFAGARGGVSAVEFALVVPVALFLFAGVVDYGLGFYLQMEAQQAAQAGTEYAVTHGFNPAAKSTDSNSSAAISKAVTSATVFSGIAASPAPTSYCGCASASGVVKQDCGTTCDDGTAAGTYLTVSASGTYNTLVPYPLIRNSFTLIGSATVRMR